MLLTFSTSHDYRKSLINVVYDPINVLSDPEGIVRILSYFESLVAILVSVAAR
jgi:hypothetical protein